MDDKQLEQQLVRRAKQGDKEAFDALMLRYQSRIAKLISRYVREAGDVHDVTQEVFIKALRALPKFRGDSTFYTWLYRIAINTAKNHLQAEGRRPAETNVDFDELENRTRFKENSTPERLLIGDEVMETVFEAINDLPEDLKQVILLRELDGMSYDEIAKHMDCPIGTVRSRIFRARETIFSKLNARFKT